MTREPLPFTVAPITREAAVFSTGTDSPVIMDSSTVLDPSSTTPSTGIFLRDYAQAISRLHLFERDVALQAIFVAVSLIRRAIFGLDRATARIALDVWLRARSSALGRAIRG